MRQFLPPDIESTERVGGTWRIPVATIEDQPHFAWRGLLLDVAHEFSPVNKVKAIIDVLSVYKMKRLHLHLTDDEGWRIEIPEYPALTKIGASAKLGGGGGYSTTAQYSELTGTRKPRGG